MDKIRCIGLDLHRDTISAAELDNEVTVMMQSVIATRACAIVDSLNGEGGTRNVTFEECDHSPWLSHLLTRRVAEVMICDPRKNKLLKSGNMSDKIDARKLAEPLSASTSSPPCITERRARSKCSTGCGTTSN